MYSVAVSGEQRFCLKVKNCRESEESKRSLSNHKNSSLKFKLLLELTAAHAYSQVISKRKM